MVPYIDPQNFKDQKANKKSDVYSVGVLLWELTSGKPPFSNVDRNTYSKTLMCSISGGTREKPIPNTPDEYSNLFTGKLFNKWFMFKYLC